MIAIALAHGADFVTFSLAIAVFGIPIAAESNEVMRAAYLAGGLLLVGLVKLELALVLIALRARVRTRSRRTATLLAYALGCLGATSNVWAVMR